MSDWDSLERGKPFVVASASVVPKGKIPTPKELYASLSANSAAREEFRAEAPDGYHYMPDGELMKDSEHEAEEYAAKRSRTKAQTPAPKKDQKKGSSENKKGSAAGGKKITFSKSVEASLQNKVAEHNEKASKGRRASLGMLKAVYRRGAGAYSTSHRPGQSRGGWAMARVNAFLRLLRSGKPSKAAYTQDNDLLPSGHPRASKKGASADSLLAGGSYLIPEEKDLVSAAVEHDLTVLLKDEDDYSSTEEAILNFTEYMGLGYETEFAVRASWLRAVRNGESPFQRVRMLATMTYDSLDADLLPKENNA
jgi:hypothetical protein